jgi:hypothetical protein
VRTDEKRNEKPGWIKNGILQENIETFVDSEIEKMVRALGMA